MVLSKSKELLVFLLNRKTVVCCEKKGEGAAPVEVRQDLDLEKISWRHLGRGMLLVLLAAMLISGYDRKQAFASPEHSITFPADSPHLKKPDPAKSPQHQASMQQVNQAKGQLERGKTDAAIRTLEKAVRIDTSNGEAFILLARAWKQKGEKHKALEFAKKAELLCSKQPAKLKEVYLLESDLYRELGIDTQARRKLRQKTSGAGQQPSD